MRTLAPSLLILSVIALSACAPKPAEQALPPAGLAGAPSQQAVPPAMPGDAPGPKSNVPVGPNDALPPGHPPVGAQVDDGSPISPKQAALPNFGAPSAAPSGAGNADAVVLTGSVLEKMDVPSYTYMRLKLGSGSEEWVAVNTTPVKVGDKVTINQQLVMENFASKSLNRTFPRLIMGTLAPR